MLDPESSGTRLAVMIHRLQIFPFPWKRVCIATSLMVAFIESMPAAEWTAYEVGGAVPAGDGSKWLRCYVRTPDNMVVPQEKDLWRDSMTLTFRATAGPLTVWLNGQKIIESGKIPADKAARFKVPKGILEKAYNAFVIRLDGEGGRRGLGMAPMMAGYFDEISIGPAWQATGTEPSADEMKSLADQPAVAFYSEKDFHLSTTPMQVAGEFIRGKQVGPAEALAALKTQEDLIVEEMLHEPQVAQPTHFSFDERGRLWVAQYRQYPYPAGLKMLGRDQYYRSKYDRVPPAPPHHDHGADIISVHEDTDGDGIYDLHKNVLTGLNMANAVVRGHGGIWVMHTPYLIFYPDANGDDVPDADPEVRLAGFGLEDTHSVANGIVWGPDGWLYGAQGSTTTSRVVRPGIDPPNAPGIYNESCMVWRYHPEKKIYEIFADGSGNTFGLAFDAEGRLYSGHNGGETRGWHHIQDGLFLKQGKDPGKFGPPPNPYAFGELPFMKSSNPVPRFSHMLCVAEGMAMPDRWMGKFFNVDPLHHTVIVAERTVAGSTFTTKDEGNVLWTDDETFRPVFLANAPDGSIMVADFREEYIAHGQNYQSQIDPDTGRIYRLRGKDKVLEKRINLGAMSSMELMQTLSHPAAWHRQTAVRLLSERKDAGVVEALKKLIRLPDSHPALDALWALHGMGRLDDSMAMETLSHLSAPVRAWTVRLLGDERKLSDAFYAQLRALAASEPDAEVRAQIVSTARRLPAAQALPLVEAIVRRNLDSDDTYIPLMLWHVVESHCATASELILQACRDPQLWSVPLVRSHLTERLMRRFAAAGTRQDLLICARLLSLAPTAEDKQVLLKGFDLAFKGRPLPPLPEELAMALTESGLASPILRLRQGDPAAMADALKLAANPEGEAIKRIEVISALGEIHRAEVVPVMLALLAAPDPKPESLPILKAAIGALSQYEDPTIAQSLVGNWKQLSAELKPSVLALLVSRVQGSLAALAAVQSGGISKAEFTPDLLTRLRSHADSALAKQVESLFVKPPAVPRESFKPRIDQIRSLLATNPGDAYKGEPLYMSRCGVCHTLFFKGGKIGPDLTAYQRDDLGTMLISIVDPNAEIREGFENYVITTKDGRALSGFLAERDANTVVLRGFDGIDIRLAQKDITEMKPSGVSLMPEGMTDGLTDDEIRHLFAYLRQSQPITK